MKLKLKAFTTGILFGVMVSTSTVATANSADQFKGEGIEASTEVTATVKDIDYKTRKVTLKMDNGEEYTIVAGKNIKRLEQVKKGDTVTASYTEALVYDVNKGGKATAPVATTSESRGTRAGGRPEATIGKQVTMSVIISEIDRKTPSVTFKGPEGETQTFKVRHPEKLQGVNVGDTVDITYSEALALKVDKKKKQ